MSVWQAPASKGSVRKSDPCNSPRKGKRMQSVQPTRARRHPCGPACCSSLKFLGFGSLPPAKPPKEQAEEEKPGGIHAHRVTKLIRQAGIVWRVDRHVVPY